MEWLLQTGERWLGFMSRVALGVVIFPHDAPKVLGW